MKTLLAFLAILATTTCLAQSSGGGGVPGPGSGGSSLLSQKVVYASKISGVTTGVAVVPGSTASGCATSDTQLNTAISGGNVDLEVDSGFCLAAPLVLSSNTTVHCIAPQFGFIMAQNSNNNVLINAHQNRPTTVSGTGDGFLFSNAVDQGITIDNCTINANSTYAVTESTHRYQNSTSTGQALMGVQMLGITNFRLTNNLIYDTPTWGVLVSNAQHVYIANNQRIDPSAYLGGGKNDDGFDTIGPIQYVVEENNYTLNGDDAYCICADGVQDASNSGDTTYYPHYHPIPFNNGPVTDVLNTGAQCWGLSCVDELSTTELIDRVQVNNASGQVLSIPFRVTHYGGLGGAGVGNVGTTSVDNWNVILTEAGGMYNLGTSFYLDATADNVSFSHVTMDNPVDGYPTFYQASGAIKNLSLEGVRVNNTTGTAQTYILQTAAGTLGNVSLSGVQWITNNSGYVIGGAVVPTTLTCSNYAGPNLLLGSGYSPTFQNGDCFTNTYPAATVTYVNTTFGEQTSGTALVGTTPATCTNGCTGTWTAAANSPSSGNWEYGSGGLDGGNAGCTSGFYCPATMTVTGHQNYTIRWNQTIPSSNADIAITFRWTNASNTVFAGCNGAGALVIYDVVAGTPNLITSGGLCASGAYSIVANGTSITLNSPGGAISGTVSGSNTGTAIGPMYFGSTTGAYSFSLASFSVKSN